MNYWLKYLWENEDGFFGIGMGPSSQEKNQYGDLGALANFATSQGESATSSANNFWQAILSGDPTKIASVLGPETSAINKQSQQKKKTAAEFGNRSGGTNAEMQTTDDTTRTSYDTMVSGLTGEAANALGASGSSLLAAGISGHEAAFDAANTIQQQKAAKLSDIFKSIASIVAAPWTGGSSLGGL